MKITHIALAGILLTTLWAQAAFADIPGHPRVNQVNERFEKQHQRIVEGIRHHRMSPQELRQVHNEWHRFKAEEREMRKMDGGHLTRADQKVLNQQLNHRSGQIWRDRHDGY